MSKEEEDFESFVSTLDSFKDLKSGISGSRIKKLTTYALDHVEEEKKIVEAVIEYSRTCTDTHKLGSLYIIDSIGRAFLDEARAKGDYIKPTAKVPSFAHGVYEMGEVIQELLTDAIEKSNDDHRDKIRTLIDIWDRTGLFQKGYLNAVRSKAFSMDVSNTARPSNTGVSTNSRISDDPKGRANDILGNLKPLDKIPDIEVPSRILSTDSEEQKVALKKFLANLQSAVHTLYSIQGNHETKSNETGHRVTEYGSRRERERQYERLTSRRTRSRSPIRNDQNTMSYQDDAAMRSKYANATPTYGTNNHHLYQDEMNVPQNPHYRPKPVSYDPTIAPDHIKVYSRTLFVGGVPMNMKEWDLASVMKPFAEVQSVILNNHRKHAFVKVYSRREAENVLQNFNRDGSLPLRTRWGVGFGPRDCCDYQHGFSIIPMHRLTDADKKWSVQAQWGGTGGQPLSTGVVFEEPDIIVGDGVSSKAISQKMPTDSGRNGPKSNKESNNHYDSPQPMYGSMPQPPQQQQQQTYAQPNMYDGRQNHPPMGNYSGQHPQPPIGAPMTSQAISPPQQQQQQNFDPTAQLNSLMNMLNQNQQ